MFAKPPFAMLLKLLINRSSSEETALNKILNKQQTELISLNKNFFVFPDFLEFFMKYDKTSGKFSRARSFGPGVLNSL